MKTILTPVDFSGITPAVVAAAAQLAKDQQGKVVLMNVAQQPIVTSQYAPFLENIGEIIAVSERAAAKELSRLQESLAASGVATETIQFAGPPVTEILKQADLLKAD